MCAHYSYIKYLHSIFYLFFFFNDTATTEIYTLSLHDALPIFRKLMLAPAHKRRCKIQEYSQRKHQSSLLAWASLGDRKSTRLNSSHGYISYAVFCLKKKKKM